MLRISVLLTIAVLHLFTADCNLICETTECEETANALHVSIDPKVEACDDFYKHVCGKWRRNHPIIAQKDQTVLPDMNELFPSRVREILSEQSNPEDISKLNDARTLYQMCTNTNQRNKDGLVALNEVVDKVGGWPLLFSDKDARENINWQEISKKIDLYFTSSSIYNIDVHPDGLEYEVNVMEPSTLLPHRNPKHRQQPDPVKVEFYKEYVTFVANELAKSRNASVPSTLQQDVEDIVKFEIGILQAMSTQHEIFTLDLFYKNMSLSDFQNEYNKAGAVGQGKINWKEIINNVLSASNQVFQQDYISVIGVRYFPRLANLLDKTPPHVIANYRQWHFIRRLLPYTTERIQVYVNRLEQAISGDVQPKSQEEHCYEIPNLKHAVIYEYAKRYFPDNQRQKVSDILHDFKNTMREESNRTTWMTREDKQLFQKKLDGTLLHIGHASWYNSTNINKYYQNLVLSGRTLLDNILIVKKFEAIKIQEKLGTKVGLTEWRPAHYLTTHMMDHTNLGSNIDKRVDVYPPGMFNNVLFSPGKPEAMNYGTISYWLGYMYSGILNDLSAIFSNVENRASRRRDPTKFSYEYLKQCFANQYKTYLNDNALFRFSYTDQHVELKEFFKDSAAIALAWTLYKRSANQTEVRLRGHDYNNDQLFFVGIAYSQCESKAYSDAHVRISTSFAGLKEFNEAFHCSANARMNLPVKCNVWF